MLFPDQIESQTNLVKIKTFLNEYLSLSFEEITTIVVVISLEKLFFSLMKESFTIHTPKITHIGPSSIKIGNINIYKGENYLYSMGVKDQILTNSEIIEAFDQMLKNGAIKGHFVYRAALIPNYNEFNTIIENYASKGFYASITDIHRYIDMMLIKTPLIDSLSLVNNMLEVSDGMKVNSEIKLWLLNIVRKHW